LPVAAGELYRVSIKQMTDASEARWIRIKAIVADAIAGHLS